MKRWFEDRPSKEFRQRVFNSAEAELKQLRQVHSRRHWLWQAAAAAGTVAVAAVIYSKRQRPDADRGEALALVDVEVEMLTELALAEDLDLWENFEEIEKLPAEDA